MSADNWAKCPRCQAALDGAVRSLSQRAADEYGKVPASDYAKLQDKLAEAVARAKVGSATFREDYEIYGAKTGTVTTDYHGSCTECGLTLSFTDKHEIPGVAR